MLAPVYLSILTLVASTVSGIVLPRDNGHYRDANTPSDTGDWDKFHDGYINRHCPEIKERKDAVSEYWALVCCHPKNKGFSMPAACSSPPAPGPTYSSVMKHSSQTAKTKSHTKTRSADATATAKSTTAKDTTPTSSPTEQSTTNGGTTTTTSDAQPTTNGDTTTTTSSDAQSTTNGDTATTSDAQPTTTAG